jgi:dinuclear metal center YbgI/SA1388 family protein
VDCLSLVETIRYVNIPCGNLTSLSVIWLDNVVILAEVDLLIELAELVAYLDSYLRVKEVPDAPEALNGLQVANSGKVTRVAAAVDLCEATIRLAAAERADVLLVHHGLFWGGQKPLIGPARRRVAGLIAADIALYSAHLPLDLHAEVGNNVILAQRLGVTVCGEFGEEYGVRIGVWGELDAPRAAVEQALRTALGVQPRVMPFGPERVRRVGVVTGGAGSMIAQAAAAGLDSYVTGEGAHHTFFDAEELGLNVFYAGHYATETVGVKALAAHLETKFGLPWTFLDHPTGL